MEFFGKLFSCAEISGKTQQDFSLGGMEFLERVRSGSERPGAVSEFMCSFCVGERWRFLEENAT